MRGRGNPDFKQVFSTLFLCYYASLNIMEKLGNIHIGHLIKTVFDASGLTVSELARRIHVERTTVYSIFERSSVDVLQLVRISVALNHNFLSDIERLCGVTSDAPSLTLHFDALPPEVAKNLMEWLERPID